MLVKDPQVGVRVYDLVQPLTLKGVAGNYYRKILVSKLPRKALIELVYMCLGVLVQYYNDKHEKYKVREVLSTFDESGTRYMKNCVTRGDNSLKRAEDIRKVCTLLEKITGSRYEAS